MNNMLPTAKDFFDTGYDRKSIESKVSRPLTDSSPIDHITLFSRASFTNMETYLKPSIAEVEVIARRCEWDKVTTRLKAFHEHQLKAFCDLAFTKPESFVSTFVQNSELISGVCARALGAAVALGKFDTAKKVFDAIVNISKNHIGENNNISLNPETIINTPLRPFFFKPYATDNFSRLFVWTPLQWACAVKPEEYYDYSSENKQQQQQQQQQPQSSCFKNLAKANKEQANMIEFLLANGADVNGLKENCSGTGATTNLIINTEHENYHPIFLAIDSDFNQHAVAELVAVKDCMLGKDDKNPLLVSSIMNDSPLTYLCKRLGSGSLRDTNRQRLLDLVNRKKYNDEDKTQQAEVSTTNTQITKTGNEQETIAGAVGIATSLLASACGPDLLLHKCTPNALFCNGSTALEFSIFHQCKEMIKVLGANIGRAGEDGIKMKNDAVQKMQTLGRSSKSFSLSELLK